MARRNPADVACLQELKAPQDKFPGMAFAEAGVWVGVAWAEGL
jgi:exonuclease III